MKEARVFSMSSNKKKFVEGPSRSTDTPGQITVAKEMRYHLWSCLNTHLFGHMEKGVCAAQTRSLKKLLSTERHANFSSIIF